MTTIFYTYVWGSRSSTGGPLTFSKKRDRTIALRSTQEGDLVFGVVSRNPRDTSVRIPDELKGRVVNAWQISHNMAQAADFGVEAMNPWDKREDGSYRWPYALQPIRVWVIRDAPEFRELPGYTQSTHTPQAITTVQKVDDKLAVTLRELLVTNGEELEVVTPQYLTIESRLHRLRQKHPFAVDSYAVQPNAKTINSIYIATLGKGERILKIGHAQDSKQRVSEFNKFRLSYEPQWLLHTDQPIGSVQDTIKVEKHLGEVFAKYRTEPNNNEIYIGLDAKDVASALATVQRR